jgi:prepilin-type processing-associated H-X9-DG protein/prepilin-type N-terminal cleavage/methylation domain-containing protein
MRQMSRGFTLVEILIVLAVLMILAALLFPVFGRVREKGRLSACQSNLKQIILGVQQYIQDNDSRPPSFGNWREATTGYIKNPNIFRCPSLPVLIKRPDGGIQSGEYNFYVGFLNSLVTEQAGNSSKQALVGVNESVLVDASKIFVSGDVGVYGFYRQVPMPRQDACGITMGNGKPDNLQTASTIHNGGGNYLFYDGHVKWLTPESFTQSLCDAAKYLHPPFRADGEHIK